jgi:hypothetical protein
VKQKCSVDCRAAHLSGAVTGAGFVDTGIAALPQQLEQFKILLALPKL